MRERKKKRVMVSPAQQGRRWTNENPCTYFGTCMFKVNGFRSHDVQKNFERNDEIGVNDRTRLIPLFLGKPSAVNDAHLFDDSGLARLSSTCNLVRFVMLANRSPSWAKDSKRT